MMELSLNGVWKYSLQNTIQPISHDKWDGEMNIPSNWELQGLHNYTGTVWFQHSFYIKIAKGKRYWLQFKGIDYQHQVFINGLKIGEDEGYFQTREYEVTNYLVNGQNTIIVKVDSPFEDPGAIWPNNKRLIKGVLNHHDTRPGSWNEQFGQDMNTGGIWNNITLYTTSAYKIENCKVTPYLRQNEAVITIETIINSTLEDIVEIEYLVEPSNFLENITFSSKLLKRVEKGSKTIYNAITIEEPKLWWTWDQGEQSLYKLTVTLISNKMIEKKEVIFGIREIYQDTEGVIYLNKRALFIRGTNYIPTQWLSEFNQDMINKDIKLMKEANINGVRLHAHVTRDEFFSVCSEQGILVWQDFALQWSYQETDKFLTEAIKQIKEMVNQFYNHPSISIWCCHNEPSSNREYLDPILYGAIKEEDNSRIVKEASDFTEHVYPGWYHGSYQEYTGLPGLPFVTEFGAQALPNIEIMKKMMNNTELWPPKWDKWAYHGFQYDETFNVANLIMGESIEEFIENSQQYQADLLKFAIEHYRRNKGKITSLFQFMFVDNWPSITWSVLDYERQPKEGYYALKQAYEPLLVSIEMLRKKINPGFPLFKSITVVNDLPKMFSNISLEVTLEDKDGNKFFQHNSKELWNIEENSVKKLIDLSIGAQPYWKIPDELEQGFYDVYVKLLEGQEVLTENKERIKVVNSVQRFDQKF